MPSLQKLRQRIDRLDETLLRLLNQRGRLVQDVGAFKRQNGRAIFVPGRERDILSRARQTNRGPLPNDAVDGVFREVINACRNLEKRLVVAYFGPEGTFTHQAALRRFGRPADFRPVRTIPEVFSEVEKGRADYGVVPIENSTEGVVNHTLDMFIDSPLSICDELELPIWQNLLARAGTRLAKVRTVYSHYQALAQCRGWLERRLPEVRVVDASSTSEAARLAAANRGTAAIASRLAGELYGLEILAPRIEDQRNNFTRFFVVGTAEPEPTGRDKTSILFSIKDRVGALYDMLVPFRKNGLNLTKIESRPTRQRAWEYVFFVDFEGHRSEARVKRALDHLERSCVFLKILGSYPRTE